MKRVKIISLIASLVVVATACNDLLEQMPSNSISGGNMWKTEAQVDQGVLGVYNALKQSMTGSITSTGNMGMYGYDVLGMTGQSRYAVSMYDAGTNAGNAMFSFVWQWCFTGIHRANDAIAAIPNVDMPEAKRALLMAECKVLRAYFYMRFNELYGRGIGVPIYKEPVSPTELNRGQSSEAEVWALVISDLTDAINTSQLPDNNIEGSGRATKGAAYAMRGRVQMLMGKWADAAADFAKVAQCGYGLYVTGTQPYKDLFTVAQEACREMIFRVEYIEEPSGYGARNQLLMGANQQGARDDKNSWTNMQSTPAAADLYEVIVDEDTVRPFVWSEAITQWGNYAANPEDRKVFFLRDKKVGGAEIHPTITAVVDAQVPDASRALYMEEGNEARIKAAYENRDPRLAYNLVTPFADFLGIDNTGTAEVLYTLRYPSTGAYYAGSAADERLLNPALPETYNTTGTANNPNALYYIYRKFVGEGLEYARKENNPIDEPVIRYADVLLMWAEALVEDNKLSEAMAKVKEVRDRAGVPTMASSFADQATARNYVRDERRREFLGEGVNFFDEMRWKTLKQTKFDLVGGAKTVWGGPVSGLSTHVWPGDHLYVWPVPRAEVQKNANLTRTPGWTY